MKARLAIVATVTGLFALAGCAGGYSSASASPTVFTPTATATATATVPLVAPTVPATPTVATAVVIVPECSKAALRVILPLASHGAGSTFQPVIFKNVSSRTCFVRGYPGVSLVNSSLHQIGTPAVRVVQNLHRVYLLPGKRSTAQLQIVNSDNFPVSSCGTAKLSAFMRVIAPDTTSSFYLPYHVKTCVTPLRLLFVKPFNTAW